MNAPSKTPAQKRERNPRLWDAKQFQDFLGLYGATFWRLIEKEIGYGNLHPRKFGPQAYRFLPAECEAIEAKYTVKDREDMKRLADARFTKVPGRPKPTMTEARA